MEIKDNNKRNNVVLRKRIAASVLTLALAASCAICPMGNVKAAKSNTASAYSAVVRAYGKKYPLTSANEIKTERKNVFGAYSTVLGVSAKDFTDYKAAKLSNSKYEYVSFICKATSKSKVKTIVSALKKFVANEKKSNENYFTKKGKKIIGNAKVGSSDSYVYLFMLDKSKNKKAIKAFKKAIK